MICIVCSVHNIFYIRVCIRTQLNEMELQFQFQNKIFIQFKVVVMLMLLPVAVVLVVFIGIYCYSGVVVVLLIFLVYSTTLKQKQNNRKTFLSYINIHTYTIHLNKILCTFVCMYAPNCIQYSFSQYSYI